MAQRSYASQLKEHEPLFNTYEHLQGLPRSDDALRMLRKLASLVKPIMRKRGWKVPILAEFLPPEPNLLGLNVNAGYKILVRLRYHHNPDLFLPMEQVIDTLLHELAHIVWGEHDANFQRMWDELRAEHDTLVRKGYTGEGFLSEGQRLGGGSRGIPPPHEMRRLARANAEKRQARGKLTKGSGQRLGGTPLHQVSGGSGGRDVRQVITDQIMRRNTINKGCASGRQDATKLSDQSANQTFKTKAEEDDANDRAIAQALYDLIEEEEERKLQGTLASAPPGGGLAWHPENGLWDPHTEQPPPARQPSEDEQMKWAMQESTRSLSSPPVAKPPTHSPSLHPGYPRSSTSSISRPSPPPRRPSSTATNRSTPSPLPTAIHPALRNQQPQIPPAGPPPPSRASQPTLETPLIDLSEPFDPYAPPTAPEEWTCSLCTCMNPMQFLACSACATERPQRIGLGNKGPAPRPATVPSVTVGRGATVEEEKNRSGAGDGSLGWICSGCGAFMEHRWWTCSACGRMKESS